MTVVATRSGEGGAPYLALPRFGLSGRLILLTMSFVMLASVIVYVPSVANFRQGWVGDRLMGAQMIALALSAAGPDARSPELDAKLLAGLNGAQAIGVRGEGTRWLFAAPNDEPPHLSRTIDLRRNAWWRPLVGIARNLTGDISPALRVVGPGLTSQPGVEWIEVVIDETQLWQATVGYTRSFLLVSVVISLITGALLYLALHLLVVRPVRRLADNVAAFAANPDDTARIIRPSGRTDEIGRAEEALARMETSLAGALRTQRHLADLGLAVSKINHELRNMLTTAHLLGDRLGAVEDPAVQRIAPRLVRTLDRAIAFCGATLAYGRASEPAPQRRLAPLRPLVDELLEVAAPAVGSAEVHVAVDVPTDLRVDADPDQLTRILVNLDRNAAEALGRGAVADPTVTISGERLPAATLIRVADNGPGIPARSRERLFSAFQASERAGGTGLGLPVAAELVRLHGGTIALEPTEAGASFRLVIPDRPGA